MSDGGLLLSWNESSHTTYMKEEVDRLVWNTVQYNAILELALSLGNFSDFNIVIVNFPSLKDLWSPFEQRIYLSRLNMKYKSKIKYLNSVISESWDCSRYPLSFVQRSKVVCAVVSLRTSFEVIFKVGRAYLNLHLHVRTERIKNLSSAGVETCTNAKQGFGWNCDQASCTDPLNLVKWTGRQKDALARWSRYWSATRPFDHSIAY